MSGITTDVEREVTMMMVKWSMMLRLLDEDVGL